MKYNYLFIVLSILSCTNPVSNSKTLEAGDWRLSFDIMGDGFLELPVQTSVDENGILTIHNSDERIEVSDIEIKGDSVYIRPEVFEGYLERYYYF